MVLTVRVQRHLVVAQRIEDEGSDWYFTLCRKGLEESLGKRLKTGQRVLIDLSATLIEEKDGLPE